MSRLSLLVCTMMACVPHVDDVPLRSPGDHEAAFEHGGVDRDMVVHVPSAAAPDAPRPLLVVLHGGGSSGSGMAEDSGFNAIADREGFTVMYPNALGIAHGMWRIWNTGDCFAPSCMFDVDDIGMVTTAIDVLEDRVPVDPERIYLVGYSNGGTLAFNLAARDSRRFAGLAVYAASMDADGPVHGPIFREHPPEAPLAVLTIHSEHDPYIAAAGRERLARTTASLAHLGQFWATAARCPRRAERYLETDQLRVTHFRGCAEDTEVKQLRLGAWNHEWPSSENLASCEHPLQGRFDAAEVMWKFLKGRRR